MERRTPHESSADDLPAELLQGLRRGDLAALEESYARFGVRVYRLCRGLLAQVSDAEDATQEVFLKVFERAHQFRGQARFTTWLHRLTVNHCLNRLEKERRRQTDELDASWAAAANTPIEDAQAAEERRSLDRLLQRMPPAQRAVIVLREIEELSYAEIAEVLQLPVGTVMSRLARAREKLFGPAAFSPHPRSTPAKPATDDPASCRGWPSPRTAS